MAGHTPGPWTYSFESVDPEWAVVTLPGGMVIANVNADHRQEGNARLISAAPDLLALLRTSLPHLEECEPKRSHDGSCGPWADCDGNCADLAHWSDLIGRIRDAIAKATATG